jgi:hypothetical protein
MNCWLLDPVKRRAHESASGVNAEIAAGGGECLGETVRRCID